MCPALLRRGAAVVTACLLASPSFAALLSERDASALAIGGGWSQAGGASAFELRAAGASAVREGGAWTGATGLVAARDSAITWRERDWPLREDRAVGIAPISPWSTVEDAGEFDGRKSIQAVNIRSFQIGLWNLFSRTPASASNRNLFSVLGIRFSTLQFEQDIPPPVPLPATAWLFLAGVGGFVAWGRRRRGAASPKVVCAA